MADVSRARTRPPGGKFEIPEGWVARGFEFEVEWPADSDRIARIRAHFGARRFAYNWALGRVKADLDASTADPTYTPVPWNLYALRKRWNAEKAAVAPWWAHESSGGQDTGTPGAVGGSVRPKPSATAASDEARTRKGTPGRGAA